MRHINAKGRAWNNLNNDGAGLLFLTKPSQEAHSWSTQRLRWFCQEQKDKPECSSYFMHVPKQSRLTYFIVTIALYLPISASHAEWIQAKALGASNDIWINTESNSLYAGDSCSPLMKLKHLRGTKPRNLRQRQQAYTKRLRNHRNTGRQVGLDGIRGVDQSKRGNTNSAQIGIDNQSARAAGTSLDPLNLSYQTQPEFDPLNRNQFNISITDNDIALTSQHTRIKARIYGRYDHRPECGF